ncbi:MAG: hypothetical protein U5N86_05090 [Planctomycetota bacterium]|nr:hypothetical protein [Planctomycetota bacterium]
MSRILRSSYGEREDNLNDYLEYGPDGSAHQVDPISAFGTTRRGKGDRLPVSELSSETGEQFPLFLFSGRSAANGKKMPGSGYDPTLPYTPPEFEPGHEPPVEPMDDVLPRPGRHHAEERRFIPTVEPKPASDSMDEEPSEQDILDRPIDPIEPPGPDKGPMIPSADIPGSFHEDDIMGIPNSGSSPTRSIEDGFVGIPDDPKAPKLQPPFEGGGHILEDTVASRHNDSYGVTKETTESAESDQWPCFHLGVVTSGDFDLHWEDVSAWAAERQADDYVCPMCGSKNTKALVLVIGFFWDTKKPDTIEGCSFEPPISNMDKIMYTLNRGLLSVDNSMPDEFIQRADFGEGDVSGGTLFDHPPVEHVASITTLPPVEDGAENSKGNTEQKAMDVLQRAKMTATAFASATSGHYCMSRWASHGGQPFLKFAADGNPEWDYSKYYCVGNNGWKVSGAAVAGFFSELVSERSTVSFTCCSAAAGLGSVCYRVTKETGATTCGAVSDDRNDGRPRSEREKQPRDRKHGMRVYKKLEGRPTIESYEGDWRGFQDAWAHDGWVDYYNRKYRDALFSPVVPVQRNRKR